MIFLPFRIPNDIGNLIHLEFISFKECPNLRVLPDSIVQCTNLLFLELSGNPLMDTWNLAGLSTMPRLTFVRIRGTSQLHKCAKAALQNRTEYMFALLHFIGRTRAMPGSGSYNHGQFECNLTIEEQRPAFTGCRCNRSPCKELCIDAAEMDKETKREVDERKAALKQWKKDMKRQRRQAAKVVDAVESVEVEEKETKETKTKETKTKETKTKETKRKETKTAVTTNNTQAIGTHLRTTNSINTI
jgi:hypothetical protein